MTELTLDMLEKYILAEEKQLILKEITPYTEDYYYMELMTLLNQKELATTVGEKVTKFTENKNYKSKRKNFINLKYLTLKLEKADKEEKKKIMETINKKYLNYGFKHQKPMALYEGNQGFQDDEKFLTYISQTEFKKNSLESRLEDLYASKDIAVLRDIQTKWYYKIDLSKFNLPENEELVKQIFTSCSRVSEMKGILKHVQRFIQAKTKSNRAYLRTSVFMQLTISQKEELIELDFFMNNNPCLLHYVEQKFKLSDIGKKEDKEGLAVLEKFLEFSKQLPQKYNSLVCFNIMQLLLKKIKMKIFDEDLFITYLDNPYEVNNSLLKKQHQDVVKSKRKKNYEMIRVPSLPVDQSFIDKCLNEFLVDKESFNKYAKYFSEAHLETLYTCKRLLAGETVEGVNEILSEAQLQALNSKKTLDIQDNKMVFKAGEKVELKAELKNIKELRVRVFEVSTENFITTNNNQNYDSIDITGLVPNEEYKYVYDQVSIVKHEKTFSFVSIDDVKRGVFIIDFVGDSFNSKALIQKGHLTLVNDNMTGRRCMILDEDNNICKSENTGIYFKNKFYSVDTATGVVSLPSNLDVVNGSKLIITHDGFADMSYINVFNDNFQLNSNLIYNPESFITGNEVEVLLQTKLTKNSNLTSLNRLANTNADILLRNSRGVETNIPFKNLSLNDKEDLSLKFILPNKIVSMKVTMTTEIKVIDSVQVLTSTNNLEFRSEDPCLYRSYLRKNEKGEYLMDLLGKNGEVFKQRNLSIELQSEIINKTINFNLQTDDNGQINLGKLENISQVSFLYKEMGRTFDINGYLEKIYPKKILINENKEYKLMVDQADNDISLLSYYKGYKLNNLTETNMEIKDNILTLNNLAEGEYKLKIGLTTISVNVIKGNGFELNGLNILTDREIITPPKNLIEFVSLKQKTDKGYELKVAENNESLKAHLITSNYQLSNKRRFIEKLTNYNNANNYSDYIKFELNKKENIYRSGKKLADELIYVYERKLKESYLGNTLEKPGMIIKRNKLGETTEREENLDTGKDFDQRAKPMNNNKRTARYRGMAKKRYGGGYRASNIAGDFETTEFLEKPGKIYSNLKMENNKLSIDKEKLDGYSFSYLIISNGKSNLLLELDAKEEKIVKKDLRLPESKNENLSYGYEREVTFLKKEESMNIKNLDNTEMCFVNSLKDVYETLKLLSINKLDLVEWDFLTDWAGLSDMEKLKKYDKFASHEMNLFLKLKDKEFFDGVVKTFLENKHEKRLIDYFLLDDHDSLKYYCETDKIRELNNLERVLLLKTFRETDKVFCSALMDYLKNTLQGVKKSKNVKGNIFDSVLNSQKGNLDDIIFVEEKQMNVECASPQLINQEVRCLSVCDDGDLFNCEDDESFDDEDECDLGYNDNAIYAPPKTTVGYNEKQYYGNTQPNTTCSKFWYTLSAYILKNNTNKDFFNYEFIYDTNNLSTSLFIISFLDIPFKKEAPTTALQNNAMEIKSNVNMAILTKEIIENVGATQKMDVLISQRFIDPNDRYMIEEKDDEVIEYEKEVTEYVKGKIYNSRIVVTNSSTTNLNLDVLFEIPQGSLRYDSKDSFQIKTVNLDSFNTNVTEFSFYFPESGQFTIYPSTVTRNGKILSTADISKKVVVKDIRENRDLNTITDILSTGDIEAITNFLESKNLSNSKIFNIFDILWLLQKEEIYVKILDIFRKRGIFKEDLWSYSIKHGDADAFKQLMKCNTVKSQLMSHMGEVKFMQNSYLDIDTFEIREYYPLINPRAHSVGNKKTNILNESFHNFYSSLLQYLFEKGDYSLQDTIILINCLICQERIQEAVKVFQTIENKKPEELSTKIQFDYLTAYIDFITGYPTFEKAKSICEEYLSYPVLSWRNLFVEIANQLAEFEEKELIENIMENKNKDNKEKAKKAPAFKAEIEYNKNTTDRVKINYENMSFLKVKYYKIDMELLFSSKPFEKNESKHFCSIAPFQEEDINLPTEGDYNTHYHNIPQNIQNENLYIQLVYLDKNTSKVNYLKYVPFNLDYHLNTEFGILKLIDNSVKQPVPKIYIKCFAKYKNGTVKFYKDGYTDLRGSFDYVSLNTDKVSDIQTFAMLIVSKKHGYKLLECEPPVKVGREEGVVKNIVSANWEMKRNKKKSKKQEKMTFNKYECIY